MLQYYASIIKDIHGCHKCQGMLLLPLIMPLFSVTVDGMLLADAFMSNFALVLRG